MAQMTMNYSEEHIAPTGAIEVLTNTEGTCNTTVFLEITPSGTGYVELVTADTDLIEMSPANSIINITTTFAVVISTYKNNDSAWNVINNSFTVNLRTNDASGAIEDSFSENRWSRGLPCKDINIAI
jgi:hypothetical protein